MTRLGTPHVPEDSPKPPVPDEPVLVSARLDQPVVAVGAPHDLHCVLEISGVRAPDAAERTPLDIVLVIDRSGSMAEHLEAVSSYVEFLLERLTPADRVALVAHAEEPELIVPLASPDGRIADAIGALSARGRTEVSAAWNMAVGILAAGERGATRTIVFFTDLRPNLGEVEPEALKDLVRKWNEHARHPASFLIPFRFVGPGADPVGFHRVGVIDDAPDAFAESFPGLLATAALDVVVEVTTAEGVTVHEIPERYEIGRRPLKLGNLYEGAPRRLVFSLSVPPPATPGTRPLGNVVLRYAPVDDPKSLRDLRVPIAVTAATTEEAIVTEPDFEVTQMVAEQKYRAVKREWDRVVMAGTRKALADAAAELRAMGDVGARLSDKLTDRLAELALGDKRVQGVLDWCDRAPSGRLVVVGEAHGTVGWVAIDALPSSRAEKSTEDDRRLLMAGVARMASVIEAAASGSPARVQREDLPDEPLSAVENGLFRFMDWRFDPERDFVPAPVPEDITRWWEEHRGLVSVRCSLHGEIARFDAGRSIGMLGAAWDAAVVEYHNRWEEAWEKTYPEFDGCDVRIEPTFELGGANLLDVEEMWIVGEGRVRPWWTYELLPGSER